MLRLAVRGFRGMTPVELDLAAGLVVVEGPNEAGKSSLLAFVLALLFPASTAAHTQVDGSIDLSEGGRSYRLERFGGRATQRLTDLATGGALDLTHLATLTGNLEASVYRSVFAFGQAELQALNALNDAAVKERLYSAAVAGAGRNAGVASRELEERASALLKPRSQSTVLGGHAAELTKLNEAVKRARKEDHRYAELQTERAQAAANADESSRARNEAAERRTWLENVLLVWPAWQEREAATLALEGVAAGEAQLETSAGENPAPATWLRLAARVSGIEAGLSAHEQTLDEVNTRQSELSEHVSTLMTGLADLGPSWTAERLTKFDGGAKWRERASATQAALTQAEEARARLEGVREGAARAVAAAEDRADETRVDRDRKVAEATQRLAPGALDPEGERGPRLADQQGEVAARLDGLTRLEDLTADLALARNRRADALEQLQAVANSLQAGHWRHWLGWGIVLAGALGAAWLAWQDDPTIAVVALALGAAAAALLWPRQPHARAEGVQPVAELEALVHDLLADELELEDDIRGARTGLGLSNLERLETGNADVRSAERQAEAQLAALAAARNAWNDHETAEHQVLKLLQELQEHDLLARQREEARARAVSEWQAWCESVGVPQGTTPAGLADLVHKVEGLKEVQVAFKGVNAKLRPAMARADEFRERVAEVATELGLDLNEDDVPATVRAWAGLLQASEAKEADLAEKRRHLEAQVAAAELELKTRFGADAERAAAQLDQGDPVGWKSQLAEADEQEKRFAGEAKVHQTHTGQLQQALTQLAASKELATNLEATDRVATEAHAQARRWLVARLAKTLIDDTLREYERTKVPDVLRRAGGHMKTMTGGAYVRMHFAEGDGLRVFTPDDEPKGTQELSRGTHEQLYLAVRLGLIESFSEANVALPLVLDDVLVNADPQRAERIAWVLAQVAERQQLLFLTCHPHLARLVLDQAPEAKHVKLQAQQPSGVAPGETAD